MTCCLRSQPQPQAAILSLRGSAGHCSRPQFAFQARLTAPYKWNTRAACCDAGIGSHGNTSVLASRRADFTHRVLLPELQGNTSSTILAGVTLHTYVWAFCLFVLASDMPLLAPSPPEFLLCLLQVPRSLQPSGLRYALLTLFWLPTRSRPVCCQGRTLTLVTGLF